MSIVSVRRASKSFGAAVDPEWQILPGHIAVIAILLRPHGLFPRGIN